MRWIVGGKAVERQAEGDSIYLGMSTVPTVPNGKKSESMRRTDTEVRYGQTCGPAERVALREDFDGPALRRLAKASKDAGQSRRLLALAEIYDGGRRTAAARIGTVGLQVVRDWVLRFNAKGPDGLIDGKATGKPAKLNDRQRQALARLVESGPIPAIHGVVRWRRKDLAHWIFEEFRISVDETTVGRELRALGYRKISARPRHKGQNEFAVEDFKKTSPPGWAGDPSQAPGQHRDRNLVAR